MEGAHLRAVMAPSKRAAPGAASEVTPDKPARGRPSGSGRKAAVGGASPLAGAAVDARTSLADKAYYAQIMSFYEAMVAEHGSITDYLDKRLGDPGERVRFAEVADTTFPATPGTQYMSDFRVGKKILRPWQLGTHVHLGNKGMAFNDEFCWLVELILAKGFTTDADTLPGAERLTLQEPNPHYFADIPGGYVVPQHPDHPTLVGVGGVAYVKGWTRSVACVFVVTAIMELQIADQVAGEPFFKTLCDIHGIVCDFADEEQRIFHNRGRPLVLNSLVLRRPRVDLLLRSVRGDAHVV